MLLSLVSSASHDTVGLWSLPKQGGLRRYWVVIYGCEEVGIVFLFFSFCNTHIDIFKLMQTEK